MARMTSRAFFNWRSVSGRLRRRSWAGSSTRGLGPGSSAGGAAFGRFGLLGEQLNAFGIQLGLTQTAVVMAVAYVSSPLYIRQAIATFEAIDQNLVAAARTLGAGPARTFFRVILPLSRRGLAVCNN